MWAGTMLRTPAIEAGTSSATHTGRGNEMTEG